MEGMMALVSRMIKSPRNRKLLQLTLAGYCFLWLLTGVWGSRHITHSFHHEFASGSTDLGANNNTIRLVQIPFTTAMRSPEFHTPHKLWRAKNIGIAIAPFFLLDEAAWQNHPLSGFSGFRLNLWFFGYTKWWPVKAHWVA
ncbi:MAG: hypothetical protein ACO1QB_11805 [Verrucomicrobiales bacterium]